MPPRQPRSRASAPCRRRDLNRLQEEIAKSKQRFGLPATAPVCTCYEAGRDGFWLHRALPNLGITKVVEDSGVLEVNLRYKHAKTDPIDAGLLAAPGLEAPVAADFRTTLAALRAWADQPVPAGLQERLLQEFAIWETLHRQVRDAANTQERQLREGTAPYLEQVRRMLGLKAVGVRSAWVLVAELFAWRAFKNDKELGALVELTPVPYDSGQREREQGISKAGNKHVRSLIVELAWLRLRWQPGSAGNKRTRKIGIIALTRKLLIALWRDVAHGELPAGAQEKAWRLCVDSTARWHAKKATAAAGE